MRIGVLWEYLGGIRYLLLPLLLLLVLVFLFPLVFFLLLLLIFPLLLLLLLLPVSLGLMHSREVAHFPLSYDKEKVRSCKIYTKYKDKDGVPSVFENV